MPEEMNVATPNSEEGRQDGAKELPVFTCIDEACDISFGAGVGRKLLDAVTNAKKSIKIISPYFAKETIDNLISRCAEGLSDISIIISVPSRPNGSDYYSIRRLINEIKHPGSANEYRSTLNTVFFKGESNYIHLKLYIIDDQIAYTGSVNFTDRGLEENYESLITIKNSATIEKLITYFDQLHNTTCIERWGVTELGKTAYDDLDRRKAHEKNYKYQYN